MERQKEMESEENERKEHMITMRNYIFFNVNGKDIQEANIDPEMPLASFLRNRLRLTGTKLSCEEGSCGSCTVVVGKWNHKEIKQGNLCRCTGYRPILEALYSFTKGECCRGVNSNCCPCENAKLSDEANKLITFDSFPHYDESQEIIFPPSLITRELISPLHLHGPRVTVFCPTNFEEAQPFLRDTENVKIVSSSMITRLASNQSPSISETWLSIHFLSSLSDVLSTESTIIIGYSSKQVMNLASWSGALCSASSSSDLCSLSLALNWKIIMRREDGTQFTVSTEQLFAVAKTLLESRNIIIGLEIPKTLTGHIFSFKQGHRLGADSTVVNSVCMIEGQGRVTSCRLVVGIEQRPILLKAVAAAIIGHIRENIKEYFLLSADDSIRSLLKMPVEDQSPHSFPTGALLGKQFSLVTSKLKVHLYLFLVRYFNVCDIFRRHSCQFCSFNTSTFLYKYSISTSQFKYLNIDRIIHSSTQGASTVQLQVAAVLGIPAHKIIVRVSSMILNRVLFLHFALFLHFRMVAAHIRVYLDGGWSIDNSECVTMLSTSVSDAIYHIPVIRAIGYALKTNKNSNTAFRGYGQPQAFYAMECIVHHIAHTVGKSPEQAGVDIIGKYLVLLNKYIIVRKSKIVKRGIAMSTTRFGLTNPGPFEQAAALVQIFLDGTVTVSIGGIEMGQGLNMKCLQIASRALGVRITKLYFSISCSYTLFSTAPRKISCFRISITIIINNHLFHTYLFLFYCFYFSYMLIERQKHFIGQNCPTYYTTGAACVEAEIDCLTGEHKLLGVDIVMDVGESLNPAIDIGQIEGGFMQGYGYLTCEEVEYDEVGNLLTNSAYKYKIPTAQMVPERFRVKLLRDAPNFAEQVYSSKGIGEPPLLLGVTAFSSIRAAIMAFRSDKDKERFMPMNAPLSAKRILELCNFIFLLYIPTTVSYYVFAWKTVRRDYKLDMNSLMGESEQKSIIFE
uniref:2Fe-2S ferredoxin-type domain-containing protein n=1 Tax=Heterorhabditis bacteriophora TaxID=37862 RepID=A0A1I7WYH5_HETBA